MRIIGGSAAGRILKVPPGFEVRPTPDLVRQAIFNSLGHRVESAGVLELFAGTGALTLECLSRGARSGVVVEKSARHARCLEQNAAICGFDRVGLLQVRVQEAFLAVRQLAEQRQTFDLILADPPYGEKNVGRRSESLAQQCLDNLELPQLLSEGGLFILGHTRRDTLDLANGWQEQKVLKHGDSLIRFLKRALS